MSPLMKNTPKIQEASSASLNPPCVPTVKMIATARILMPASVVRLSAGRAKMSASDQALCFMAGANSVFLGDVLLTTANPAVEEDRRLFADLGLQLQAAPNA